MMDLVESSWILHLSCNKRRIAPIAALLSSVLHPLVFSDLSMHEMSCGNPGPLKWVSINIFSSFTAIESVYALEFILSIYIFLILFFILHSNL